jgi:hypothetical protein
VFGNVVIRHRSARIDPMPLFLIALRESVRDPDEMRLYAEQAGASAHSHRLTTRAAMVALRMTGASLSKAPSSLNPRRSKKPRRGTTARSIRPPWYTDFAARRTGPSSYKASEGDSERRTCSKS